MLLDQLLQQIPSPKRLVLSLLSAPDLEEISARECVRWGALFDIDSATMRVALGRLVQGGLLCSLRRGVYGMGSGGESLRRAAQGWREVEQRLAPWNGDWLLVHTGHLGRANRGALRKRELALRLEGMRELPDGLWCRPANYFEALEATRERMLGLGLEPEATVLRAAELLGGAAQAMSALWPREPLERGYRELGDAMRISVARIDKLELPAAARESFLLGETVIRFINADPLLPAELVDSGARRKLVTAMLAYDVRGRDIWARFRSSSEQ